MASSALADVVIGDCNVITNLNFNDTAAIDKYVRTKYAISPEGNVQFVIDISACGQKVDDAKEKLNLLIISLDQMLLMKEQFYIPAIDQFIADPTEHNLEIIDTLRIRTVARIETAIDKLVDFEVIANDSTSAGKLQKYKDISGQLLAPLSVKLSSRLSTPHDLALARQPAIAYKQRYVALINDIKDIVASLKSIRAQVGP